MMVLTGDRRTAALSMLAVIALVVLAAIVVDPRRELLTWDDGWAYARSVVTLLETGRLELDQWSAANMPVQIGLGAAAAHLFGYSITVLRMVTLALLVVLLAAFYALTRQEGIRPGPALALTIGLFASPLVLMLSFTFMSDIQFLAWLILALVLYRKGLVAGSVPLVLTGAVAAACAIGTRQFGIVLIAGWLVCLIFARPAERPRLPLVAAALALPVLVSIWQLWLGAQEPNFTQQYRLAEQRVFFAQPAAALVKEAIWRTGIWMQYLALFCLPIMPLVIGAGLKRLRRLPARVLLRAGVLTAVAMVAVAAALALNSSLTVRQPVVEGPLWPALGIIWMLPVQPWATPRVEQMLDLVGFLSVAPIVWLIFAREHLLPRRWPPPPVLLLAGTAAALWAMMMIYVQFNDTYVVSLLPFALLAIGAAIRGDRLSPAWSLASIVVSLTLMFTVAGLTRQSYDEQQVEWDEAERAVAGGASHDQLSGPRHYLEYHGGFDDWIAAGAPGLEAPPRDLEIGQNPFHDPFYRWLDERGAGAGARP